MCLGFAVMDAAHGTDLPTVKRSGTRHTTCPTEAAAFPHPWGPGRANPMP
jgi:hypothetical protein